MHQMKKKYGQNFITDTNLLKKIVKAAQIDDRDVVEIGPGIGSLSAVILEHARTLTAYEIDMDLKKPLETRFKDQAFQLVIADFLKVDLSQHTYTALIGNIPYYITTPILFRFFEHDGFDQATLMMQKEVGERLLAVPKTKAYNALSVMAQSLTDMEVLVRVKRQLFYPIPNVDSMVIQFKKRKPVFEKAKQVAVFTFVKAAFKQKRKTLVNNLMDHYHQKRTEIEQFLNRYEIPLNIRAEALAADKLIEMAVAFHDY